MGIRTILAAASGGAATTGAIELACQLARRFEARVEGFQSAALAGGISAVLVSLGGYPLLFAATAVVAAAGSTLVWKIKSVP